MSLDIYVMKECCERIPKIKKGSENYGIEEPKPTAIGKKCTCTQTQKFQIEK